MSYAYRQHILSRSPLQSHIAIWRRPCCPAVSEPDEAHLQRGQLIGSCAVVGVSSLSSSAVQTLCTSRTMRADQQFPPAQFKSILPRFKSSQMGSNGFTTETFIWFKNRAEAQKSSKRPDDCMVDVWPSPHVDQVQAADSDGSFGSSSNTPLQTTAGLSRFCPSKEARSSLQVGQENEHSKPQTTMLQTSTAQVLTKVPASHLRVSLSNVKASLGRVKTPCVKDAAWDQSSDSQKALIMLSCRCLGWCAP